MKDEARAMLVHRLERDLWIATLVQAGWQDGSGLKTFLRAPDYDRTRLVLMADDEAWTARCGGVTGLPVESPAAAVRDLLKAIVEKRRLGATTYRSIEAALEALDDLSVANAEASR